MNATATPIDGPKLAAVISAPVVELDICGLKHVRLRHGIDRARLAGRRLIVEFVDADVFDELNDRGAGTAGDLCLPAEEACRWMR